MFARRGGEKISTQLENAGITINISGCGLSGHLPFFPSTFLLRSPFVVHPRRYCRVSKTPTIDRICQSVPRNSPIPRQRFQVFSQPAGTNSLLGKNPFDFGRPPKFHAEKWTTRVSIPTPLVISLDLSSSPRLTISPRSFQLEHI